MTELIAGLLILAAALASARGARALGRGLREARPLDVVRGLRSVVVALAAATFAAGKGMSAQDAAELALAAVGREAPL